MKHIYFALLVVSLSSVALAQNKNAQDPTLHPHHANAIKPILKAPPARRDPGAAVHKAGGPVPAARANTTDAQLNALERQQATAHNPKPVPKAAGAAMAAKANNPGPGNKPMNFTYKAPNANNAVVGGTANGRKVH